MTWSRLEVQVPERETEVTLEIDWVLRGGRPFEQAGGAGEAGTAIASVAFPLIGALNALNRNRGRSLYGYTHHLVSRKLAVRAIIRWKWMGRLAWFLIACGLGIVVLTPCMWVLFGSRKGASGEMHGTIAGVALAIGFVAFIAGWLGLRCRLTAAVRRMRPRGHDPRGIRILPNIIDSAAQH